ncbi:MAG: cbb3-type cytochrome c oxidase subunit 3 [Thiobacillus sp.]|nr:cbb3-type cytochrome c oxidase subunit 3 [Thiobacillus sp.]
MEWLLWFSRPENTKPLALIIFFFTFVGIVAYVYGSKKRSEKLESYRDIPFLDDQPGEKSDTKDTQ